MNTERSVWGLREVDQVARQSAAYARAAEKIRESLEAAGKSAEEIACDLNRIFKAAHIPADAGFARQRLTITQKRRDPRNRKERRAAASRARRGR